MNPHDLLRTFPPAVVWLRDKRTAKETAAPAAFVFPASGGFAFIEPGYLDPDNTAHRFHRVRGAVLQVVDFDGETGVSFDATEWTGRIERYTGTEAQVEVVGTGLARFAAYLQERKGRTVEAERERLRAFLASELQ